MLTDESLKKYTESEEFKKQVALFTLPEDSNKFINTLAKMVESQKDKVAGVLEGVTMDVELFLVYQSMVDTLNKCDLWKADTVNQLYGGIVDNFEFSNWTYDTETGEFSKDVPFVEAHDYDNMVSMIPDISLILYMLFPSDPFYPLLSDDIVAYLQQCETLGITLPDMNVLQQADSKDMMWFYLGQCLQLEDFRHKKGLTKEQMCALLYGYDDSKYHKKEKKEKDEPKGDK